MLEIHLGGSRKTRPVYPDSGPGTKVLEFGNEEIGYFGEVTGAELFTASDFLNKVYALFGTRETGAMQLTNVWLKFFHKGKVIYIAKQPFIAGTNWNDIYNAGLVYGTQDNGKYPATTPVWQFNPLSKNDGRDWVLIPRLFTGMGEDPYSVLDQTAYIGSEWTELLGRVADVTNTPVTEKWARFSVQDLGLVNSSPFIRYAIAIETRVSNSADTLYMGSSAAGYSNRNAFSKNNASSSYRPVLVLHNPADGIIPVINLTGESFGLAQIEMAQGLVDFSQYAIRPAKLMVEDFVSKFLLPSFSIDPTSAFAPRYISANNDSPEWGSFTISGSYVA